ncbi:50S ribosomal protein L25 [Candidatus Peregrinibacteria bacterium]|nr:50S ribosomal protein L25 [Candidatus Peregrinibacteria bacterium]
MDTVSLEVQSRDTNVKAKDLLKEGLIPLEYYGRGIVNKHLQVEYQAFRRAYNTAGNSTVIELLVDGKDKIPVLVHGVMQHPITNTYTHIDFIHVRMDEEVHAKISLEFTGTSLAVKDLGGTFMSNIDELEVQCLPKDLVHSIEVDISPIEDFTHQITVADVNVPDNIEVLNSPEDTVATVVPPRIEEEPEIEETEEGEEGEEEAIEGEEGEKPEGPEEKSEGGEKSEE